MFRQEQERKESENNNSVAIKRRCFQVLIVCVFVLSVFIGLNNTTVEQSVNWRHWITGKSVSSDFHYLDLLELLFRLYEPTDA